MSIRARSATTLSNMGFKVVEAACGEEALSLVRAVPFDAVLLDVNMPGLSGVETCKIMRRILPRIPIIMLSVRDSEADKVGALDGGADDYITKPFQLRELTARIRAAMRWRDTSVLEEERECVRAYVRDIELDPVRHTVKKANRLVHLTPKEFELTRELMTNAGKPIPYARLL